MRFVSRSVAALLGIGITTISSNVIAQDQDFSQVEIETIPVKDK